MSAGDVASGAVALQAAVRSDAVTALVEREAPGLLAYFMRRVASPEDAADLLGDTLLVVWRRKAAIPDDPTKARMWMYGVARKVLSGHRRGNRRRTALGDRLRIQLMATPTTFVNGMDDHSDVRELIEALPAVDREIIRLVHWEGFTLAEVADIMSMRPGTVRSRHSRAMSALRDSFSRDG